MEIIIISISIGEILLFGNLWNPWKWNLCTIPRKFFSRC